MSRLVGGVTLVNGREVKDQEFRAVASGSGRYVDEHIDRFRDSPLFCSFETTSRDEF